MSKIIGLVNTCRECPNRRYESGGVYQCEKVGTDLDANCPIPDWCPLPNYPTQAIQPSQAVELSDEESARLLEQSDLLDMHRHIGWYSAPERSFKKHGMALIKAVIAAINAKDKS